MYFLDCLNENVLILIEGFNWHYISIGLGNGLALDRLQAISWTKDDTGFELNVFKMESWNHMGHMGIMITGIKNFLRQICVPLESHAYLVMGMASIQTLTQFTSPTEFP